MESVLKDSTVSFAIGGTKGSMKWSLDAQVSTIGYNPVQNSLLMNFSGVHSSRLKNQPMDAEITDNTRQLPDVAMGQANQSVVEPVAQETLSVFDTSSLEEAIEALRSLLLGESGLEKNTEAFMVQVEVASSNQRSAWSFSAFVSIVQFDSKGVGLVMEFHSVKWEHVRKWATEASPAEGGC